MGFKASRNFYLRVFFSERKVSEQKTLHDRGKQAKKTVKSVEKKGKIWYNKTFHKKRQQ